MKKNGINRIMMLTDGDFNVGISDVDDMLTLVKANRDRGISLSTVGFGRGNLNDYMMEQMADNGNGNYSYIDSLTEAKKSLVMSWLRPLIRSPKTSKSKLSSTLMWSASGA